MLLTLLLAWALGHEMPQKAYIINADQGNTVGQQYRFPSQHGPFRQGTDTFTVIERTTLTGPPIQYWASVYLAASGTSSVEQDATNAPELTDSNSGFGCARLGSVLYLAYPNLATRGLSVITFDMITKRYGVANANPDTTAINTAAMIVLSDGTALIQVQPRGTDAVTFTSLSAGVFSAYQTLSAHGDVGTFAARSTTGDIFYADHASPPQIQYRTWAGGVLSGATATGALGLAGARLYFGPALYLTGRDELLVPFSQQRDGGPLALLRGSPSVALVWTYSVLVSLPNTSYIYVPAVAATVDESTLYYAWRYDDAVSGNATVSQVLYMTQANGAGPWSGSAVYYDFYANPPNNSTVYVSTFPADDPPNPTAPNYVIVEDQSGFATGVNSPAMSIAVLPGDALAALPFSAVFAATQIFIPPYVPSVGVPQQCYADIPHLLTTFSAALPNPGPGTKRLPSPTPNQFDFCLHREYRLYCAINVAMITCGSIPACFSVDERDWAAGE